MESKIGIIRTHFGQKHSTKNKQTHPEGDEDFSASHRHPDRLAVLNSFGNSPKIPRTDKDKVFYTTRGPSVHLTAAILLTRLPKKTMDGLQLVHNPDSFPIPFRVDLKLVISGAPMLRTTALQIRLD